MEPLKNIFNKVTIVRRPNSHQRAPELFEQILTKLNSSREQSNYEPITRGRLAYLLTGIPTKNLYALINRCDDAERRGFPWSAIFWKEITPNTLDS